MRKFEIISENQWVLDTGNNSLYDKILHPKRGTKKSAGYDFFSPIEIIIPAHGMAKIPTGIKVCMNDDEFLSIYPRSSIGFKTSIRLANTVGIVDADYYNNSDNEGHIFIKFYNPTDKEYSINVGDKIAQGIFMKYLTIDNEEDIDAERTGGFGSTGK